ncbi:hypothetical protein GCK32_013690 [Trichostrongylus colubriformis]|uniref:Uncharacterized protein n=1 Tax=Trichostrongylus colubriformis TaxID=6319 RepID=A0AAN8G6E4_TRICO
MTAVDVGRFLNDALRRYYSTSFWPVTEDSIAGDVPQVNGDAKDHGKESKVPVLDNGDVKPFGNEEQRQQAHSLPGVSTDDLVCDDASECSTMSSCSFEPSLRETDPAALDRYYLVQGRRLVQLFQLCPQCGHRLSETELNGIGTAAIVNFVCQSCGTTETQVQRWESQERTVAYDNKRTYKGNLDAAVAAVTTGLRYVELRQWAKKLNLALFSKGFFSKVAKWSRPNEHVHC